MIVCHCNSVSDREIRSAVRRGACTLREVANACGAGTGCGGCCSEVAAVVRSELGPRSERRAGGAPPESAAAV